MEEEVDYEMKDFTYYSRIVMMIIYGIQLILFIVFIVVIYGVESDMDKLNEKIEKRMRLIESSFDLKFIFSEQKQGIETCISFFIIAFVFFLVEFIFHFGCDKHRYERPFFERLCRDWNHLITILTFVIGQFLYIIACLIIPIYLHRVRTLDETIDVLYYGLLREEETDLIDSSIARYAVCFVIAFVFLVIFIFLYFIILNLYKGVCCDMIEICRNTNRCIDSFFGCFLDNVNYVFQGCEKPPEIIEIEKKRKRIAEITCSIQNEMKKNIELRVKNIELL